jgi:hypothetical protein
MEDYDYDPILNTPSAAAAAEPDGSPDIHSMDFERHSPIDADDSVKEDDGYSLPSPWPVGNTAETLVNLPDRCKDCIVGSRTCMRCRYKQRGGPTPPYKKYDVESEQASDELVETTSLKDESNAEGVNLQLDFSCDNGEDVNVSPVMNMEQKLSNDGCDVSMNEDVGISISSSRGSNELHPSPKSPELDDNGNSISNDDRGDDTPVKKDVPISSSGASCKPQPSTILKFPHLKQEASYTRGKDDFTNEDAIDSPSVPSPASRRSPRFTFLNATALEGSPDIHSMDLEHKSLTEGDGYSLSSPTFRFRYTTGRTPDHQGCKDCGWVKSCMCHQSKKQAGPKSYKKSDDVESKQASDEPEPACLKDESNAEGINLHHDFSFDNVSPAMNLEQELSNDGYVVSVREDMAVSPSRDSNEQYLSTMDAHPSPPKSPNLKQDDNDNVSVSKDVASSILPNEQTVASPSFRKSPHDEESLMKSPVVSELEPDQPRDTLDESVSFNDGGGAFDSPLGKEVLEGSDIKCSTRKRLFDEEAPGSTRTSPRKKGFKAPMQPDVKNGVHVESPIEKQGQVQAHFSPKIVDRPDAPPRVSCTKIPFHVDVSSKKSFYTEIEIRPPLDSYHPSFLSKTKRSDNSEPWIVKMGDTGKLLAELFRY